MTQMNARLEIASRLMAALVAEFATGKLEPWKELWDELRGDALREADALIAEEARTRPPAAKEPYPVHRAPRRGWPPGAHAGDVGRHRRREGEADWGWLLTATLTQPPFTRDDLRAADWSLQTATFQARHVLRVRPDGEMYHGLRLWYPCSVQRAAHYVELGLPVRLVDGEAYTPTTNILAAVQLATGTHPVKVNQAKQREAQRVAAVLLRERGLSRADIARELGVSRDMLWRLLSKGARPEGVASALEQARKLLRGAK